MLGRRFISGGAISTDVVEMTTFSARGVGSSEPVNSYAPAGDWRSPMSLPSASLTFATSNPEPTSVGS